MLKLLSRVLVPSCCVMCNSEGQALCDQCERLLQRRQISCYLCNALTAEGRVCASCQWRTRVRSVSILWRLNEASEKVVYGLKFDGRDDLARFIARRFTELDLPEFDYITYVADTPVRYRQRGFVTPRMIAREISRLTRMPYIELLTRDTHIPQVGAGRDARWRQVKNNFQTKHDLLMEGKRILLVDDVITTGATITECARVLKLAGAGQIHVVAVAKK